MSEDGFVRALLVLGVVLLLAGTFAQSIVTQFVGKVVPQLVSDSVCQDVEGFYYLSLPTEPQVCEKISGMKGFLDLDCNLVSAEKRSACQQLQKIVSERIYDCASSLLLNESSTYFEGSQEAVTACDEFSA